MLRQQLIVLKLSVKQPKFTNSDRVRLTLLARLTKYWQSAPHIVQPDTVLPWHRDMFKRYWRRKSQSKNREPRTPLATISLIKQMARENLLWGAEEIHGELLKLGIEVSKSTIQKYIDRFDKAPLVGKPGPLFSRITLMRSGLVILLSFMTSSFDQFTSSSSSSMAIVKLCTQP